MVRNLRPLSVRYVERQELARDVVVQVLAPDRAPSALRNRPVTSGCQGASKASAILLEHPGQHRGWFKLRSNQPSRWIGC